MKKYNIPEHLKHLVRPRGLADPLQNPGLQLRRQQFCGRPPVAVVTVLKYTMYSSNCGGK